MTRVLYVLNSATGGATESALDVMRTLRERGVTPYAAVSWDGPEEDLEPIRRATAGVARVYLPWWNRNYRARLYKRPLLWARDHLRSGAHFGSVLGLRALIRRWNIDVVHTNTALTLDPALAARLCGRAHVWHIREQIGREALIRFWLSERWTARVFLSLSDAIVANSNESARLFERQGLGTRVDVVYNGVELQRFADATPGRQLRASWGVPDDVPLVGMVAHLTSRMKRHDVFVRAAAHIRRRAPRARFVVIGRDPTVAGGYRSELEYARGVKALASSEGVADVVQFVGAVADPAAAMNALDLLVHPSDQESFGRVVIEAMAAGIPVVGASTGGVGEILAASDGGVAVAPGDAEGFADASVRILSDATLARRLGERGRASVAAKFSLARACDDIAGVYRRVLS